jgi:hypothetical protein
MNTDDATAGARGTVRNLNWTLSRRLLPLLVAAVFAFIAVIGFWFPLRRIDEVERRHEASVQARMLELKAQGIQVRKFREERDGWLDDSRRYFGDGPGRVFLDPPPPFPWDVARDELHDNWGRWLRIVLVFEAAAIIVAWPRLPVTVLRACLGGVGWCIRRAGRAWRAGWRWVRGNWMAG